MLKRLLAFMLLVIFFSGCQSQSSKKSKSNIDYLLVILSNKGELKQGPNGKFQLIMQHKNMEDVLVFSNRPYRIVGNLTDKALQGDWVKGSNSFEKDHPNAAVVIDQKAQAVILDNITVTDTELVFTVSPDGPESLFPIFGKTSVFLDWCIGGVCMPCTCGWPGCNDPNSCD